MKRPQLAIVAAQFNRSVVDPMIEAATQEIEAVGGVLVHTVTVPGSYETVLVVRRLLARSDVDAVVVLGFIERGETLHGEVMGQTIHRSFVDLELTHDKPIGIGIIGPGATEEQAHKRKIGYARAAVAAAIASLGALEALAGRA